MIILKKYRIDTFGDEQHVTVLERVKCPDCGGRLRPRGTAKRKIRDVYGNVQIYYIRRLRCPVCGAFHTALPDFIVPHKHYSKQAINLALTTERASCIAETSTVQQWARLRKENHL